MIFCPGCQRPDVACLAGLSPASWGPGAEGCDLLAGRGLGGPSIDGAFSAVFRRVPLTASQHALHSLCARWL